MKDFPYILLTGCRKEILRKEFLSSCIPLFAQIFVMGICCLIILYALWKRMSKPAHYLSDIAKKIAEGKLEIEISRPYPIEMRQLATHLKQIAVYMKKSLFAHNQLYLSYQEISQKYQELTHAYNFMQSSYQAQEAFIDQVDREMELTLISIFNQAKALLTNLMGEVDIEMSEEGEAELLKGIMKAVLNLRMSISDTLNINQTNVNAVIESVLLHQAKESFVRKISLQYSIAPEISSFPLDEIKFKQVILGLISRALQFTPAEGRIEIKVNLESAQGQKILQVTIQDTGLGLSTEDVSRLLQKFYQRSSKNYVDLTIIEKLVQIQEGTLLIENEWKKGTTVKINLPYKNE